MNFHVKAPEKKIMPLILAAALAAGLSLPASSQENNPDEKDKPLPQLAENKPLELDIYGGIRDLYRIAVPKPLGHEATAVDIMNISEKALVVSSLFKVLDSASFIADMEKEGMGISPDAWNSVGAQGVIKCRVKIEAAGYSLNSVFTRQRVATSPCSPAPMTAVFRIHDHLFINGLTR